MRSRFFTTILLTLILSACSSATQVPLPTKTLQPTIQPTFTRLPVVPTATSRFIDDIRSGTGFNFDKINWTDEYWTKNGDAPCNIQLKESQLEFSSTGLNANNVVCVLSAGEVTYENVGSMEANFKALSGTTGDDAAGIIEFSKGAFDSGAQNWVIQCGIHQSPNQSSVLVIFGIHINYPRGTPEFYARSFVTTDSWYKIKLEIIPESDKVICYLNDKIIGIYDDSKLALLHNQKIDRHLLGLWTSRSQAVFYIDNVKLYPPK